MNQNDRNVTKYNVTPTLYLNRDAAYDIEDMAHQDRNMTARPRTQTNSSQIRELDDDISDDEDTSQQKTLRRKKKSRPQRQDAWVRPRNTEKEPKKERKRDIIKDAVHRITAPRDKTLQENDVEAYNARHVRSPQKMMDPKLALNQGNLEGGNDAVFNGPINPYYKGLPQIPTEVMDSKGGFTEIPGDQSTWRSWLGSPFGSSSPAQRLDNDSDGVSGLGGIDLSTISTGLTMPRPLDANFKDGYSRDSIDLSKLLNIVKEALENDPSASYFTQLKQTKSIETVELALAHLSSSFKRAQDQLKEKDLALSTMQQEKSAAETARAQHSVELRETRSKYETVKEEKMRWEVGYRNKETEARELEKRVTNRINEITRLNVQLQSQIQATQSWGVEVERLKGEINLIMAKTDSEKETLKKENEDKIKELERQHNAQLVNQQAAFDKALAKERNMQLSKIDHLEGLTQELTGELLKRDHHNSLKDRDIILRFSDLVDKIDYLARTEWSERPVSTWPLSPHVIRTAANPREAKQYKLQDQIWRTLYHHIFCSPFRVFGHEGIELEKEWQASSGVRINPDAGNGFEYPKTSPQIEKWRYETVQRCFETLTEQVVHESDPKYKLQQSHKEWVSTVQQDVQKIIGCVASYELTNLKSESCREIAQEAAQMWLDFGKERYRLIMLMPTDTDNGITDDRNSSELIIQPELRRIGNARGEDLHLKQLVGDPLRTYQIRRR